jgi:hypothetical protein
VVKKTGLPRRTVILSKLTVVGSFEEWYVLEVGAGQSFLRKWSEQSFPRADSFSPGCTLFSVGGMAQIGGWSRFSNQGHVFPSADSFSPGCILFSAGGMAEDREWSKLKNQNSYSSLLEQNSPDSSSLMFDLLRADALLDLTNVSGRMAQMIQFIS